MLLEARKVVTFGEEGGDRFWEGPKKGASGQLVTTHFLIWLIISLSVQSVQSGPTLCDPMDHSTPGFPVHHQLPELAQTHVLSVMPSNHLILCHLLLLWPSIFPSIRVFSNEYQVAKVLDFHLQHQFFQ